LDDTNPIEPIVKYAKENPYWVTPVYSKTQSNPIFTSEDKEEDEPPKK